MNNFPTPHCHIASLDSASTPEAFAARETDLGTGVITCTDHGTMGACREVYDLARKQKLTAVLGLEGYLRDDSCDILKAHGISDIKEYWKYGHITLHFLDQEAYETGSRLLSEADLRAERHGSDRKPLFTWKNLEELGGTNTIFTSSCLGGVVQRHLVDHNRADIAEKYYQRVRSLVKPGNFYVEIFPHNTTHYWVNGVIVTLAESKDKLKFWNGKKLRIESEGTTVEISAEALADSFKKEHPEIKLVGQKDYQTWVDLPPVKIEHTEMADGFLQNECRPWAPDGDLQKGTNRFMLHLAKKYGDPVLLSDDSHYVTKDEKAIQDVRLMAGGGTWRFYGSYHRYSSEDAWEYFRGVGVSQARFESWIENNGKWAERFKGFKLETRKALPTNFYPSDTLAYTYKLIEKHGRMNWNNPAMVDRLKAEIKLLHDNGTIDLLPYFMVDEEVCDLYRQNKMLTGPGRGSAAGLLLAYLEGITHVNPLRYDLSMDRFLTLDSIQTGKLPDIDQDLPTRDLLTNDQTGWLKKRFGENFAQISTNTMLRIRSSIKDVHRVMHGYVSPDVEILCKKIPVPPQGIDDAEFVFGYKDSNKNWIQGISETDPALKEYISKYPNEWKLVVKCLGLVRQKSRHACAYVISNDPIKNFIPLVTVGKENVRVTQYTAESVEAMGGLKMDFLIINSLNDIAGAIQLIQNRQSCTEKCPPNGLCSQHRFPLPSAWVGLDDPYTGHEISVPSYRVVPLNGKLFDIWDLPEDQSVFAEICHGRTETVFQFNTPGARQWLREFVNDSGEHALRSIEGISAFTALDRPGPLDARVTDGSKTRNMLQEFAARSRGESPIGANTLLDKMLPETHGVIVYQEQLQKVFMVVGKTDAVKASQFRQHIAKKKMDLVRKDKETFMPGAIETLGEAEAQRIWDQMETFGQYGFNKSHATCYVVIGYACAWLKYHYPLEWWTSVLSNATRNEIDTKFWPHVGHMIDTPDIQLSGLTFTIQNERIRAPLSLLNGIGPQAAAELDLIKPKDIADFCTQVFQIRQSKSTIDEKKPGKMKLGRSALNRTILAKLIVSGAMDSLFPPNTTLLQKFELYEVAMDEVTPKFTGKKRANKERLENIYSTLSMIEKFQLSKSILPTFGANLIDLLLKEGNLPQYLKADAKGRMLYLVHKEGEDKPSEYPVVPPEELYILHSSDQGTVIRAGVIAYIVSTRPFTYHRTKHACEIVFEVHNETFTAVKWPDTKEGKLDLPKGLDGSIVAMSIGKIGDKPLVISNVSVVKGPLNLKAEESSS